MRKADGLKVVIASSGRRAHYLQWFQDGLRTLGVPGEVIAMEFRPESPSFGLADRVVRTPAYNGPEYADALRGWCELERPDLFLSLNDYELQILSGGLADELRALGCKMAVLGPAAQRIVLDKHRMAAALAEHGIPTPRTRLGSETDLVRREAAEDEQFVVKHRFGSGASGFLLAGAAELERAVANSATSAPDQSGRRVAGDPDTAIVQDHLPGPEYGADCVFSMDRRGTLLGVVARRKERSRAGDTDVATSVAPERFEQIARALGEVLTPSGSIDVDLREDADGELSVIDINPRLGGGYPFNHRAGADLPSALLLSTLGREHDPRLLAYEHGLLISKREEFTVVPALR